MTRLCEISFERERAAEMLRAIRRVRSLGHWSDQADELLDWASTMLPQSKAIQRLKARRLVEQGHHDDSDACLRALLARWPHDRLLMTILAENLLARGEVAESGRVFDQLTPSTIALQRSTVDLADRVYAATGDHAKRADVLYEALLRHPHDADLRHRYAHALLCLGCADDGLKQLRAGEDAPTMLLAEALDRSGRPLEAMEILDRVAQIAEPSASPNDDLLCKRIELSQSVGDETRLAGLLAALPRDAHSARLAGAACLLRGGQFDSALRLAISIVRSNTCPDTIRSDAAHAAIVAAASCGRSALADRLIRRLRRQSRGIDPNSMAAMWRRALLGHVLANQRDARLAGRDAHASVLTPLLEDARSTLQKAAESATGANLAAIQSNIGLCEAALGETMAAITALCRSQKYASETTPQTAGRIGPAAASGNVATVA